MQDYDNPYSPPQSENDFISQKSKYQKTGEQVRVVSFLEWLIIILPIYLFPAMFNKQYGINLLSTFAIPVVLFFITKNKNLKNFSIALFIVYIMAFIIGLFLGMIMYSSK
ncbi:MAG: hypothetical protein IJV35_05195 [Neisseriaceae bacterium]|nr:hypothetical protein [Neisseriaceae bacterium]